MDSTIRRTFDVDIDLPSTVQKGDLGFTQAMIYNEKTQTISPHPSGYYFEEVPVDPVTSLCSFDYEWGDSNGFMKVDLLTNRVYDQFKTKKDVLDAIEEDNVDWSLFQKREIVEKLPHLGKHFETVRDLSPKSIEDVADILALIRPAKRELIPEYKLDKKRIRRKLYLRPRDNSIYFKKSHAISYALMIVCYLTVLDGGIKW